MKRTLVVGEVIEVAIEKVAHGGHFIARYEGCVIFVRHAIPGEKCRIQITSVGRSFNRADVVEVLEASNHRVDAPCEYSNRDGCGGCDFQHITIEQQRSLKAEVIVEQFARIAKMEIAVDVESVGTELGWRSRITATSDKNGKLGFIGSRSHTVVPVKNCLIAAKGIGFSELATRTWKADMRVEIATSNSDERSISLRPNHGESKSRLSEGPGLLHEKVLERVLEVSNNSFWQSHTKAPNLLSEVVRDFASVKKADHVLDLYGGVGLFTAALIDNLGPEGRIDLIEGSKSATADAARNFLANSNVKVVTGDVATHLPRIDAADVVVLDPPREGAGKVVVNEIARAKPRTIVYVACDPAALARDTGYFLEHGFSLVKLRAFDLFPMTHHIECVALFEPAKVS
ncbi:MAG: TRAM domain-containing protein [Actinomycetales bacterium]|nr:TRAM domain-containing protein [Actinomycetales bacterium]